MNIPQQIKKAEQLAQAGQLDSAILVLQEVIKHYPKQGKTHGLLGLLYIFKKDYSLAEQHLLQSLQSDFNIGVAANLTTLLTQQQRWQEAYPWSQKLVAKLPKDIQIQLNHAQISRNSNQTQEALDVYQRLIKDNPKALNSYISYGYTLNQLERYEEAVEIYLQGLMIHASEYGLLYNLGITYLNKFEYDNSLKYLSLALKQNKQSIDLWLTIAVCQAKKRDLDAAFASINQAQKLDTNNLLVPFQMGTLLLQQDRNKEALVWLNKVINKDPQHIEANYHKALIYLKEDKYAEALPYYRYRIKRTHQKYGKFNDFELPKLTKDSDVIISWEQGIGDEILYLGLINKIQKQVKSVSYITQDKLYDWVNLNLPDIYVIKESDCEAYLQKNNNQIKLNIASLMAYVDDWDEYFKEPPIWEADEALCQQYLQQYKSKNEKILGISWMSANKKIGDEKTIPLKKLVPILQNQKTISLQYGEIKAEIDEVNQQNNLNIIQDSDLDYFNDINSLAALISICDVVVTCSNVTAHIAGRLGIKTYLLVPKCFGNIWYWNAKSNQSRWYPSITILKQDIDGDWERLVKVLKEKI